MNSHFQEREDEKWRPIISVEAILLSVQNMLADPNESSPANIDAAVVYSRNNHSLETMEI